MKVEGIYRDREKIGQEVLTDEKRFEVFMKNGNKERFFRSIDEGIDFSLFIHHVNWAKRSRMRGYFFINLKPSTLVKYSREIVHVLDRKIVVEIREDFLTDEEVEIIKRLREDFPFLLSIDDMGKGASNLDRVRELLPNFIKLDIKIIGSVSQLTFFVSFLREFAPRSILIAEKVETEKDYRMIRGVGIKLWQGWYERQLRSAEKDEKEGVCSCGRGE